MITSVKLLFNTGYFKQKVSVKLSSMASQTSRFMTMLKYLAEMTTLGDRKTTQTHAKTFIEKRTNNYIVIVDTTCKCRKNPKHIQIF